MSLKKDNNLQIHLKEKKKLMFYIKQCSAKTQAKSQQVL